MDIIEWKNLRVLTTEQLADAFGCDVKTIQKNFIRNKDRYAEGKHFLPVNGEELKSFKTHHQIDGKSKHSPVIYLWTEKGCWMHAKSVNTDQAWEAYEGLVDDYFRRVEQSKEDFSGLSPQLQFMIHTEKRQNELEAKQVQLEDNVRSLKLVVDNEVWVTEAQKSEMKDAVKRRIGSLKEKFVDAHFQGLYGDLNTFFKVSKYDKIARKDFEQAMEFIQGWFPKTKEKHS